MTQQLPGDRLLVEWLRGGSQDVITAADPAHRDGWPPIECSPQGAIALGQALIAQGTAALAASNARTPQASEPLYLAEDFFESVEDELRQLAEDDESRERVAAFNARAAAARRARCASDPRGWRG